ncbi:MAG TPA: PstS family phosphate ABC transporter substrate-binding protein [Phycisphaerales bacterium]|nr:PstS family phosphate ABC transporter substrate-binding protein [Phycisphaerales bacterium]
MNSSWKLARSLVVVGAISAVAAFSLAGPNERLTGSVKCDGSSTVEPITSAVAEEFKAAAPNVNVTVGTSGTGGGFQKFCVGDIDISDASRPIKKEEHEKAVEKHVEYIELPIAYDGLSIVVNKGNTWVDTLTIDEIRKVYLEGGAKKWSEVRAGFPDKPIKVYSPGTDSGTFDYFKEIVAHKAGKDGTDASIRSDMSVSEDDNVLVRGVEGDAGAIGYFGCAYYFANKDKLKAVSVDAGKGAVAPTHETIEHGTYAPFSRPLFIYVNRKAADRPEVKAFVDFYLDQADELVEGAGYVKLPSAMYETAKGIFRDRKTGTKFLNDKGEKVSGPLSTIYAH